MVAAISAVIMAMRICARRPAVLLQAVGEFKPLAGSALKSSAISVIATLDLAAGLRTRSLRWAAWRWAKLWPFLLYCRTLASSHWRGAAWLNSIIIAIPTFRRPKNLWRAAGSDRRLDDRCRYRGAGRRQ